MNTYLRFSSLVAVAIVALCSGCATITSQSLTVTSDPSGAEVTVRNSAGGMWHWGATPVSKPVSFNAALGNASQNTVWVDVDLHGYSRQTKTATIGTSRLHFTLTPIEHRDTGHQQQQQQQTVIVPGLGSGASGPAKGSIAVVSDQEDAEVYVDGVFSGNCPANLRLSEGIHIIEVKKTGFQNYRRELRVSGDSRLTLRVQLKK